MKTYCVDFLDEHNEFYSYDVGAESLFDAAAAIMSDEKGCRVTAVFERIDNPMTFIAVVKNHNDIVIYQGESLIKAAAEKRHYEYHTGNRCTVSVNGVTL